MLRVAGRALAHMDNMADATAYSETGGDYNSIPDEEMTSPDQQEADMKILRAKQCSNEAVKAGAKAAAIACVASAIPILLGARAIPWARANLNHAAQALIISTISGSAYFIVADKTILNSARRNSFREQMENQAEYWPF